MKNNDTLNNQKAKATFLIRSINAFLKVRDLDSITVQNDYGVISVTRNQTEKSVIQSLGFIENPDACEKEQGEYNGLELERIIGDLYDD